MNKKILTTIGLLASIMGVMAQTSNTMDTSKVAKAVVNGYNAVEKSVVNGYNAVENAVVGGYTKVSDAFIMKFFAHNGETLEQAKERLQKEEENLKTKNKEMIEKSRIQGQEIIAKNRKYEK